ncbi:hypothetical protein M422DRAFT_779139 [Sphaerobolus stellatus SS14]|uniref:Unplaced genomic scaffold SPHSTscaffold_38, whole genome shotgun sequence n=1 Tax=Sphaerobolus stellatus (strain SS14) TaxID=990650 RepID=A0A0C9W166_SPHS4|nr:hypothetical protein M422DRAFT_779139 [Sphaerobolus stellatus SS14]
MIVEKKRKRPQFTHLFTESTDEARCMGVGFREEGPPPRISPASLSQRLRQSRKQMEENLKNTSDPEMTIEKAVSLGLFGLGSSTEPLSRDVASLDESLSQLKIKTQEPKTEPTFLPLPPANASRNHNPIQQSSHVPSPASSVALAINQSVSGFSRPQTARKHPGRGPIQHRAPIPPPPSRPIRSLPSKAPPASLKLSSAMANQAPIILSSQSKSKSKPKPKPKRREVLQRSWTEAANQVGAAAITISEGVSEDDLSNLDPFQYLETGYIYKDMSLIPSPEFLLGCHCNDCKEDFALCQCQMDSDIHDEDDAAVFPYNHKRRFTFPYHIGNYIVECNDKCSCSHECPSRVAQRPRTIPLEIFRTQDCGLGVRSLIPIRKGTVLGMYTGELIKREVGDARGKQHGYIFDLDFMDQHSAEKYSVDGCDCGNWTRFVSHCCEPTCSIYPAVWDSPPSAHQPHLVFVAKNDIPTLVELTIDYRPQARKGKQREKSMDPDSVDCRCGAETCRGSIYG